MVQWADPDVEKPDLARKIQRAHRNLPPEFERPLDPKLPFTRLPDADVYADEVGFSDGFPVARDPRSGKMWLVHRYGMVGAGRDNAPDSGGGTELYAVIGHAPRQLDRNVTCSAAWFRASSTLGASPRHRSPGLLREAFAARADQDHSSSGGRPGTGAHATGSPANRHRDVQTVDRVTTQPPRRVVSHFRRENRNRQRPHACAANANEAALRASSRF